MIKLMTQRFPAGRRPGCLKRKSAPGVLFPMASERIKIIPQKDWLEYAASITLRPYVKHILNQGSVGSCATEMTAQSVMTCEEVDTGSSEVLNPWFIYQETSGGRDGGSSIDENLAFAQKYGVASEAVWPRSKGWRTKPSEEAYADAAKHKIKEVFDISSVEEMVSALLTGYVVGHGAKGHAILAVAYSDDSPLIANSWDTDWEDGGFGHWCTWSQINWSYGAFAVRTVVDES